MPKAIVTANKEARKALATGEIASNEIQLKKAKDLRTLYIRFKVSKRPNNPNERDNRFLMIGDESSIKSPTEAPALHIAERSILFYPEAVLPCNNLYHTRDSICKL